jgi:hypothetical protein
MGPFATVSIKDLQNLEGVSYSTARRNYRVIADSIGLGQVMVHHLAKYWDTSVEELQKAMRPVLKK